MLLDAYCWAHHTQPTIVRPQFPRQTEGDSFVAMSSIAKSWLLLLLFASAPVGQPPHFSPGSNLRVEPRLGSCALCLFREATQPPLAAFLRTGSEQAELVGSEPGVEGVRGQWALVEEQSVPLSAPQQFLAQAWFFELPTTALSQSLAQVTALPWAWGEASRNLEVGNGA